jgi:hypothetical protein
MGEQDRLQPPSEEGSLDFGGVSYEAEAAAINAVFRMKLIGLRRRFRPWEIPAVMRAIRDEKQAAMQAMRERRQAAGFAERQRRRQARAPPQVKPP